MLLRHCIRASSEPLQNIFILLPPNLTTPPSSCDSLYRGTCATSRPNMSDDEATTLSITDWPIQDAPSPTDSIKSDIELDDRTAVGDVPSQPLQKRRRVTRACDECRRKKIKCDGKQPCTHCSVYSYGESHLALNALAPLLSH